MKIFFGDVGSTPIDDFLSGAGRSSAGGARLETIGIGLGLAGTILAVGVVVLLAAVHSGRRSEVRALLLLAMAGGAAMLAGGAIEAAGTAAVLGAGWIDVLTDGSASSALLRLLGGLLVLLGLGDDGSAARRWVPGASSSFGSVGVALGACRSRSTVTRCRRGHGSHTQQRTSCTSSPGVSGSGASSAWSS